MSTTGSTRDWHGIVRPGTTPDSPLLEEVGCFRCEDPGTVIHDLDPFALRRCSRCKQHFVSPRLSEAGRAALYGDSDYFDGHVYRNRMANHLQRTWVRGRLDAIAARRGAERGDLLEVGGGYGVFLEAARERGWTVSGLEYSPAAASEASQRLGVPVQAGVISDIVGGEFDVVCAWDVVEHVPDPGEWTGAARTLLRPGGTLALSMPYYDSAPARFLGRRWGSLKPHKHIWHFTVADVRRLLEEHGFADLAITTSPLATANRWRLDSMVVLASAP